MTFCLFGSSLVHLDPKLQLFEVDDNSDEGDDDFAPSSPKLQTAVTWVIGELERNPKKSSNYNFQDNGHISSAPAVHI